MSKPEKTGSELVAQPEGSIDTETGLADLIQHFLLAQDIKPIDLDKRIASYANCWVTLSADERRVIAHGKHPKVALTKAYARGESDPILMWAPTEHRAYIV